MMKAAPSRAPCTASLMQHSWQIIKGLYYKPIISYTHINISNISPIGEERYSGRLIKKYQDAVYQVSETVSW